MGVFVNLLVPLVTAGLGFAAARGLASYKKKQSSDPLGRADYSTALLAAAEGGYYYQDLHSGEEVFSSTLLHMLALDDYANGFDRFSVLFDTESFALLTQALADVKAGKAVSRLSLVSGDGARFFECNASLHQAAPDTEEEMPALHRAAIFWFRDVSAERQQQSKTQREADKNKLQLKHFSGILNSLTHPVWQRGPDLTMSYCNLAYSEIMDEASEKIVHSEAMELHKNSRALARLAQSSGEPKSERRHIIVHGQRKWYEIHERRLTQEGDMVGFAFDMSEVEEANEEMQRHISAQEDLLESSTSAMAIYGADMRLKSYNVAFAALWKLEETWLDTEPTYSEVLEALRSTRKLPEQANFPAFKQQQLKLFTALIEPQEEFFYLPDGRTLRVIAIPHALGGILFAYEDVTDRLALESSYNTLIAVQKETLDKLHEGVAVFGEDGRLKLSNPMYRKLWEMDGNFISTEPHLFDVLDKTKQFYVFDEWEEFKKQLIAHSHMRKFNHQRLERTDGSVVDWSSVPLPDGATLFTFLDVTDSTLVERSLREKNEALEQADKLKTEFLANVSYELRSPLTSISGFSEMLGQDYFGSLTEKQREYVEGINQSAKHLSHLINDILDLATIEAGYMRLDVTRFNIHGMLSSVIALVRERAKEVNISIKLECAAKIGTMLGDDTRIRQAVFNLLSNALKYTEKGGKIILGAEALSLNDIVIWVEDNGVGIAPEEQQAVLGKFYRGSSQGAPKSGTGLGLPMVKSLIELHGGRVELQSELGKGTRVTCYLQRNNPNLEQYFRETA